MDTVIFEWVNLLLRWTHVIAGMAWIGASFYFMHIDAHLQPVEDIPAGKGGEAWEVHGGGFYQVRKFLVAPARMPEQLLWHKWQAYTTWLSGVALLVWLYYFSAELFLIDPAIKQLSPFSAAAIGIGALIGGWVVYDSLCRSALAKNDLLLLGVLFLFVVAAAYAFQNVFSGRGALIHTGALMATMMAGNVGLLIIPNQRKVVDDLIAGRAPDPALGKLAKQRSAHNNYLTLPVVFLMLANHYPLTYQNPWSFGIVALVLVAGALIRFFYNMRHQGKGDHWWAWAVAAIAILGAIFLSVPASPEARAQLGMKPLPERIYAKGTAAAPDKVTQIVQSHCAMCHAQTPSWPGIGIAPKGVLLDTAEAIERMRPEIGRIATQNHAMPPNNLTGLSPEDRAILAAWVADGPRPATN